MVAVIPWTQNKNITTVHFYCASNFIVCHRSVLTGLGVGKCRLFFLRITRNTPTAWSARTHTFTCPSTGTYSSCL